MPNHMFDFINFFIIAWKKYFLLFFFGIYKNINKKSYSKLKNKKKTILRMIFTSMSLFKKNSHEMKHPEKYALKT